MIHIEGSQVQPDLGSMAAAAAATPLRERRRPPGPDVPRTLQTIGWLLGSPRFMEHCRARYGDVFAVSLLARAVAGPGATRDEGTWVLLADPEHVKQLFSADPSTVRTGETNGFLKPLVGARSILVLDEPDHMTQRKLMLPPLHGDRVKSYADVISAVAQAEIERWPIGEPFALWPRMQAITLEVIVRTVFGISEPDRLDKVSGLLRTMLNRMTSKRWLAGQALLAARAGSRRAQTSKSARGLVGTVDEAVSGEIRRHRGAPDLDERDDILSILMRASYDDGQPMSDEELRDEAVTLLIAGHESTATMLAWAFERLLRHPDKLARFRAEARSDQDEYADAVVRETLRLRPVLPIVLRKLAAEMEIGGYSLPPGTWVAPCAYLIHRREEIYPEPERFLPERFLGRQPDTYAWMPFGGGVRRCLGASFAQLEMKQVLRTVVANVELRPAGPAPERIRSRFITLAPSRGAAVVMVRAHKRSESQ
jgi:cytochrome P450